MAGARGGARSDAVDPQLLTELPDEVEALACADLCYGTLCHRLTPFRIGRALPRLASRRCAMLVGAKRSASPRTAATAVPRLARPRVPARSAPLAMAIGVSFDERRGNIAPVALGQQVLDVNLRQRGRTLAAQHAPGRLVEAHPNGHSKGGA